MTRAARIALAAILFAVVAVSILTLATLSGCLRAQQSHKGASHEAPRITPGPVAGSAGSRETVSPRITDAERCRMTPARSATFAPEAQMAEQRIPNPPVPGSTPGGRASSRLLGSPVEDKPGPALHGCIGGWLRPTTRKGGPSATSQSHSATREATASRTQRADLFSFTCKTEIVMAEELGPIDWWVWLLADPKQRKTVNAATRMLALRKGVLALGVPLDKLDAEAVRA